MGFESGVGTAAVVTQFALPVLDLLVHLLDVHDDLGLVGAGVGAPFALKVVRVSQLHVLVLHVFQDVVLVLGQVITKQALESRRNIFMMIF